MHTPTTDKGVGIRCAEVIVHTMTSADDATADLASNKVKLGTAYDG